LNLIKALRILLVVAGLATLLGVGVSAAQAAPVGGLKQFRVPTPASDPKYITQGSDGNLWFTESDNEGPPNGENVLTPHNIGRITPDDEITEFPACFREPPIPPDESPFGFCFPNDIVQGPDNVLYFTKSEENLGRMSTATGELLPNVDTPFGPGAIARDGSDLWLTDFGDASIWRYDTSSSVDEFAQFQIPSAPPTPSNPTPIAPNPSDVAVAADGTVWFTDSFNNRIGSLNPSTRTFDMVSVPGNPYKITIATNGTVWYIGRFDTTIGRLDPANGQVTEFPISRGPHDDIAAAPDGSVWFTQFGVGNVARIDQDGTITEGRKVKGSGPFGITVASNGDPWYTMFRANRIATLQLR